MIQALDFGAGNLKSVDSDGAVVLSSQVAAASNTAMGRSIGLKMRKPPLCVNVDGSRFYVGPHSHDWGRPIENLADERFIAGDPAMRALVYGVLKTDTPLHVIIGLPQSALGEDRSAQTAAAVKKWMTGEHAWELNGKPHNAVVTKVTVASQVAGALFDYLLDDNGKFAPGRKAHFREEIGIISVGMNTVEFLAVRNGAPIERFTDSITSGVRRLLELVDPQALYSRGELDERLRAGRLDVSKSLPVWGSEVVGHIERVWGRAFRRFSAVLIVGGGALLLQPTLVGLFNGKSVVMPEPVTSVARGLYKLALMKGG